MNNFGNICRIASGFLTSCKKVLAISIPAIENDVIRFSPSLERTFSTAPPGGSEAEGKSSVCPTPPRAGVVLGAYESDANCLDSISLTPTGIKLDKSINGKLMEAVASAGGVRKKGDIKIFYGVDPTVSAIAVVNIGQKCTGYDTTEIMEESKEAIRMASGLACKALQEQDICKINVESFGHAESAAEGAGLGIWVYQEFKDASKKLIMPNLDLFDDCDYVGWQIGLRKAAAQNLSRQLAETPANLMTPQSFAQNAVEILCKSGVNAEIKVQGWIETQKMAGFLSVAKGSCEPPVFLELSYYGTNFDDRPIVLIGSGVTFDSGGLCLKTPEDMKFMKGDMSGAAVIIATIRAIAQLQLPINIRALIPLCENMPGSAAFKPGDIVPTMSGKFIRIEDTDCEGRLLVADALWYSQNFWPKFVLDIGTFTRDVQRSLGTAATGVWTNSDCLWEQLQMAGIHTGDRVWRLPLWGYFTKQVTTSELADVESVGFGPGGGHNRLAAFLREFVPCGEWMHLDSYGVMRSNGENYLRVGMSGRPTRTLVEFIAHSVCKN